jgi:hypothetical protein
MLTRGRPGLILLTDLLTTDMDDLGMDAELIAAHNPP